MPVYNVFSVRHRPRPDQLTYDALPLPLRAACLRIIKETFAGEEVLLRSLDEMLEREHPVQSFRRQISQYGDSPPFSEQCIQRGDFYEAMSAIEICAHGIDAGLRERSASTRQLWNALDPTDALDELNHRFLQYGVGYQFSLQTKRFVRVDSEYMHAEVVAPAMLLLTEKGFEGPAQEFDLAQRAHRDGRGKDAVTEAVRAVESTAKAIMDKRGWAYETKDTINPLLQKLFENGLVPPALESNFAGLRAALTSGLPTIGNNFARHGQGPSVKPISEHMVTLGLHFAAATIRFLVKTHLALPSTEALRAGAPDA